MISFGQNFEDVILARALSDIQVGNYVDVGAHDPEIDSVTNHFYRNGWHGINIEPQKQIFEKLKEFRTRDINLNLCVGDVEGQVDFAVVKNRTGWSTSSQEQIKNLFSDSDLDIEIELIEQKTLSGILKDYALGDIHFLKVDVEGSEFQVLKGLDLKLYRPWIMVIEATMPGSLQPNFDDWEQFVLKDKYIFAYSDGLNRFYLAEEHADLLPRFSFPPNVLDDFESQHTFFAKAERDNANTERDNANTERDNAITERDLIKFSYEKMSITNSELNLQLSDLNDHIARQEWEISQLVLDRNSFSVQLMELKKSLSWKVTKPLRYVAKLIRFR